MLDGIKILEYDLGITVIWIYVSLWTICDSHKENVSK